VSFGARVLIAYLHLTWRCSWACLLKWWLLIFSTSFSIIWTYFLNLIINFQNLHIVLFITCLNILIIVIFFKLYFLLLEFSFFNFDLRWWFLFLTIHWSTTHTRIANERISLMEWIIKFIYIIIVLCIFINFIVCYFYVQTFLLLFLFKHFFQQTILIVLINRAFLFII